MNYRYFDERLDQINTSVLGAANSLYMTSKRPGNDYISAFDFAMRPDKYGHTLFDSDGFLTQYAKDAIDYVSLKEKPDSLAPVVPTISFDDLYGGQNDAI